MHNLSFHLIPRARRPSGQRGRGPNQGIEILTNFKKMWGEKKLLTRTPIPRANRYFISNQVWKGWSGLKMTIHYNAQESPLCARARVPSLPWWCGFARYGSARPLALENLRWGKWQRRFPFDRERLFVSWGRATSTVEYHFTFFNNRALNKAHIVLF